MKMMVNCFWKTQSFYEAKLTPVLDFQWRFPLGSKPGWNVWIFHCYGSFTLHSMTIGFGIQIQIYTWIHVRQCKWAITSELWTHFNG